MASVESFTRTAKSPVCVYELRPVFRSQKGRFCFNREVLGGRGSILKLQLPQRLCQNDLCSNVVRDGKKQRRCLPIVACDSRWSGKSWENDSAEYLFANVVDAVSMLPLQGRLFMTLSNGREVEVDHINPAKGRLLYRSRSPAIFLKIEHDSDLLLPIVVGETAVSLLMRALHEDEKPGRPNYYQLLKNIVGALDCEARMVRITERIKDTYYARIYFNKDDKLLSVDARPSDAINFAVKCKVPIFVNKAIVDSDAVRPVYTSAQDVGDIGSSGRVIKSAYLDSPDGNPDPIAEEITLMKEMLLAVVEERYTDAARCRDQLNKLRISSRGKLRQSF